MVELMSVYVGDFCGCQVLALLYAVSREGSLSTYLFLPKMQMQLCDVMLLLLEDKSLRVSCEMLGELSACVEQQRKQQEGASGGGERKSAWYTSLLFAQRNSLQLARSLAHLSSPPCHWRARRLVCVLLPSLVATTSTAEGRTRVSHIVLPLLSDPVFEVRKAACRALCLSAVCDVSSGPQEDGDESEGNGAYSNNGADQNISDSNSNGHVTGDNMSPTSLTPDGE